MESKDWWYFSQNETERNYEIHDKEMLVVIQGLEN